jgi:hypothetical protein
MSVRITCINKDNGDHYDQHLAITHLGWLEDGTEKRGKATRLQIVEFIENGNYAYVEDNYGNIAKLIVKVSYAGNKYVKTVSDGKETNNLLALSEC